MIKIFFVTLMRKLQFSKQLQLGLFLLLLAHPAVTQNLRIAELTMVPVMYGALLLLFGKIASNLKISISKPTFAVALVGFLFTFLNASNISRIQETFQENHSNWRYMAITQINNFFYDSTVGKNATLDPTKTPYVITATNPYFVDMYANGMYQVLPLYENQRHKDQPQSVWGEGDYSSLIDLYHSKLSTNPVYLSDVDIKDEESIQAFNHIHDNFDLTIKRIGCDFNCFVYEVSEESAYISPEPSTVNLPLSLETLTENYSFSILSTRFDPESLTPYTLQTLSEEYQKVSNDTNFMIVTGNLLPKYDEGQFAALSQLYLQTEDAVPVLYNPGNLDLIRDKKDIQTAHSFATNQEYFLFLEPDSEGGFGESQQASILNQILKLEKMPQIKTIFVISHLANWVGYDAALQEMSGISVSRSPQPKDRFMIQQVLPRLEKLSEKEVFVISGDISPTADTTQFEAKFPNSNLTFLSSGIFNSASDTSLRFTKFDKKWSYQFIVN